MKRSSVISLVVSWLMLAPNCPVFADSVAPPGEARRLWEEAKAATDAGVSLATYNRIVSEYEGDSLAPLARLEELKGLYSLGQTEQALTGWVEWLKGDRTVLEAGSVLYWYILTLMDSGQVHQAAITLEEVSTVATFSPGDTDREALLRELLIACHLELGEPEQASRLALGVVKETTSDDCMPLLLYDLARAYEASGTYDKAQETWKLLRDSYPLTPEATYAAAEITEPKPASNSPVVDQSPDVVDDLEYILLLRSFRSATPAEQLAQRVREMEISARVDELEAPSGPMFSVVAGPISGKRAAERVKRELVSQLALAGIVLLEQPDGETLTDGSSRPRPPSGRPQ